MEPVLDSTPYLEDLELEEIPKIFQMQRNYFNTGITRDINFRIKQLKKIKRVVEENKDRITEAVSKDMGRPYFESYAAEVGVVLAEVSYVIKNLKKWAKPRKVGTGLAHFKSNAQIEYVPKGVSLVVSAWNYPIHLCLMPLISSVSAGNTVLIKPSEFATHSAILLDEMIEEYFDKKYIDVIPGGVETAQTLLEQGFDQIIFTGSEKVGRIYAKAAAETLTPIILEMGGKSPTIVDKSAKLDISAQRILFGKFLNASQTCVAPDYLLVHSDIKDELLEKLKIHLKNYYGDDAQQSKDYGRLINERQFNRVLDLLGGVEDKVIIGGETDKSDLYIEPTLVDNPAMDNPIMQEEIFGPLLPILTFDHIDEIVETVRQNPNPLVTYIFAEDKNFISQIRQQIQSGDVSINDAAIHFAIPGLKVGGIRGSGMGGYRGKTGFAAFSHKQTVYRKSTLFNLPFTKPPYTSLKEKLMKFFIR